MDESNIEQLSRVFHEAWCDWVTYFLEGKHTPKDLARWVAQKSQKYKALPEDAKEKRREWARRVLEVLDGGK
jgi:glutathione S-transferase